MALKNIILKLLPFLNKENTYNYALYLGEYKWGDCDQLILIATNGNVKFIGDAHKYNFNLNGTTINQYYWDKEVPGREYTIPNIDVKSIKKKPKHILGFDGTYVTAFSIKGDTIRRLWKEVYYDQIPILNELLTYDFNATFGKQLSERNQMRKKKYLERMQVRNE